MLKKKINRELMSLVKYLNIIVLEKNIIYKFD